MSLGKRIKSLRQQKQMTLRELSKKVDISISFLSDIENERSNPSLERLNDIAKALDTTASYLLGEDKQKIETKAYHNLDTSGLSDEDIKKVEEYIELLKNKYNPDGTLKK